MKAMQFLAIMLTALALVPVGAHALELPGKLALDQADYFVVQAIYRGWAWLGTILVGAILANLALAWLSRRQTVPFLCALAAFVLMAVTLATFFALIYPANQATDNWTVAPDAWEALRADWEATHATNAGLTLVALGFVTVSALGWRRRPVQAAS